MDISDYIALSIFSFYFLSCKIVSAKGLCSKLLSNGTKVWHCCDNHEDINGTCVVCANGYRSDSGEACRICPIGLYGRKCGELCVCKKFQECNNIVGCRNMSDGVNAGTRLYDLSTSHLFIVSSVVSNTNDGKINTEMIFIICTVTLSLVLIICMIWFRYYTKQRLSPERKLRNSCSKAGESNELHTLKAGGIYNYIDESQICDLVKLPPIDQTIKSKVDQLPNEISDDNNGNMAGNNKDGTDEVLGDGYLKPYKSLELSKEIHRYSRIEVEDDGTSPSVEECNKTDEILLVIDDISSDKNPIETPKYISMYEPDVCTVDVHRAVSMHEPITDAQPTELDTNGSTSDFKIT